MNKNGFTFTIREDDIKQREQFGGFELLRTVSGIMYRNNAGFHVWCTPYATSPDGKTGKNSLYSTMELLMNLKDEKSKRKETDDKKEAETMDNVMDALAIALECSCSWPTVAFSDSHTTAADFLGLPLDIIPNDKKEALSLPVAFFFANRYMGYLTEMAKNYLEQEKRKDNEDDSRILFEDKAKMIDVGNIVNAIEGGSTDGTGTKV